MENFYESKNSNILTEAVFYPETATLLLNIDNNVPNLEIKKKEAEKLGLSKKEEFHFTVIGSNTGKEIIKLLSSLNEDKKTDLIGKIIELNQSIKWEVVLKDDFYFIENEYNDPDPNNSEITIPEKRQSIIQIAEIKGLDEFYKKLNQK